MKNQRGFIGFSALLAIVLAIIVIGGGAYYVMHQSNFSQTPTYQDQTTTSPATTQTTTNIAVQNTSNTSATHITIDPIATASINPTFSGTASGLSRVIVGFAISAPASYTGSKSYGSAVVNVTNGQWTYTAAPGFFELGNDYTIDVYPATDSGKVSSYDNPVSSTFTLKVPSGYKMVVAPSLSLSFAIPEAWAATSSSDGGANYWSPDLAFGCHVPSNPTAEPCQLAGSSLSVSVSAIAVSAQNPTGFVSFYKNTFYGGMPNESVDTSLSIHAADAIVIAQPNAPYKQPASGNVPDLYIVTAHILKNTKDYQISVDTTTSFADSRAILVTALQTMQ